jgi:hypothetical protein
MKANFAIIIIHNIIQKIKKIFGAAEGAQSRLLNGQRESMVAMSRQNYKRDWVQVGWKAIDQLLTEPEAPKWAHAQLPSVRPTFEARSLPTFVKP